MDLGDRKFLLNLEAEMFEESEFRIHEMVSYFASHKGNFVFELTERAAIEDYNVFRQLLDEWDRDSARFRQIRAKYLLY